MPETLASSSFHAAALISLLAFASPAVAADPPLAITNIANAGNIDAEELVGVIKSLGALEGKSNAAISTLIRFLFDERPEVRLEAIKALRKSGLLALGAAAPILSRMAQIDPDVSVKHAAAETLRLFDMEAHLVNGLNPQRLDVARQRLIKERMRQLRDLELRKNLDLRYSYPPLSDYEYELGDPFLFDRWFASPVRFP